LSQALDLQDQRCRSVRVFLRALGEIFERDQVGRIGNEGEMRIGRRGG
jgi:hypothetical protein